MEGKGNEITAIPQLFQLLDLEGALVTIDAIGCQKKIAHKIVDGGGDYVLVAKGNQEKLLADIQKTITQALEGELPPRLVHECTTKDKGHGRTEERSCVVVQYAKNIRDRAAWPNLTTVGMCRRDRTINGVTTTEVCYFIGSRRMSARAYAQTLRSHWGIENNLHWQLDVSFREDESRIENRYGAANLALFRKTALGLLKRHPRKDSIKRKRKGAALDTEFLAEILAGAEKLGEI